MVRFLLLQVIDPHYHQDLAKENMAELSSLVTTYGGEVVERSVQHRVHPNPKMYIGAGKLDWVKEVVRSQKINVIVLNDIVNASQIFRLEQALWEVNTKIAVWDRVDLILNIFEQHASSVEAKLQIELARIQRIGPRIYGLGATVFSRQGGGIGTRGLGETNIERERRVLKKRAQKIREELARRSAVQEKRIERRKLSHMTTVALVGYTSAGKTSLFNMLTNKAKETNKGLFTTLDSVVGRVKIAPYSPSVLISDTIGFIDDLPPELIDAFRSTLQESLEASLLFHVIDCGDERMIAKYETVNAILTQLGVPQEPILVFNKIDTVKSSAITKIKKQFAGREMYFVSAKTGKGIDLIKKRLAQVVQHHTQIIQQTY